MQTGMLLDLPYRFQYLIRLCSSLSLLHHFTPLLSPMSRSLTIYLFHCSPCIFSTTPFSIWNAKSYLHGWRLISNNSKLVIASICKKTFKTLHFEFFSHRVCSSTRSDSNASTRYKWVIKIADGNWRQSWITGVYSKDMVAFTHSHGTVAADVCTFITRLGANMHLCHSTRQ